MLKITDLEVLDIRFPTSQQLDGSDAMNPDPDYSAAYVILKTDHPALTGCGNRPARQCLARFAAARRRSAHGQ